MSTKKSYGRDDRDDDRHNDRHNDRDHKRTIVGTNGNDTLTGTSGDDTIIGRGGNDKIIGGKGNDNIDGGKGNDYIDGGKGNDRLDGGQGDDTLTGGAGNDYIDGGPHGHDTAVYSGNYLDYRITFGAGHHDNEGCKITVFDKRIGAPDGTDTLRRIEVIKFADGEFRDGHFYPSGPSAQVTTVTALSADTGASSSDFITSIALQTVTGTFSGALRTGDVIQVSADNGAHWVNAIVSGSTWSAAGVTLVSGSGSLITRTIDTAGHTLPGALRSYVLDTVAAAPGAALASDTGVASDHITSDGALALSGVEPGATVQYSTDGGATWAGSFAAVEGPNSMQVRQIDVAGNTSAATTLAFTLDTAAAAPGVALANDTGIAGDHITSDGALALSGMESGAAAQYSTDGGITWTNDFAAHSGPNSVQVRQIDVAGNASAATTLAFILNHAPVLEASLTAASYEDTAASDDFEAVLGSLTATDPDPNATQQYGVFGGAPSSSPYGYDTAKAGAYGTVYVNSQSGAYTYIPNDAGINALPKNETAIDSFALTVFDGLDGTDSRTLAISLTGANDTPVLTVSLATADFDDTEKKDAFSAVTGSLSTADADTGATRLYAITDGEVSNELEGYDTAGAGIYGTLYLNSASGAYTFVPASAVINALPVGTIASDSFTLTVDDGLGGTDSTTLTMNISGANDASVISGVSGPLNYTVGVDDPVAVAPSLTLGDVDSNLVTSARVVVSAGFSAGNDTLQFTVPPGSGITGIYDDQTGVLQFSGDATLADYQLALASVHFSTNTAGGRTISFTVFDNLIASVTVDTSNISLDNLTTTGFRLPGEAAYDLSGFSASAAGDVNGDGFADVIIGAPFADNPQGINPGINSGTSYLVFGKASSFGTVVPLSSLDGLNGFRLAGEVDYDSSGFSVHGAGDLNGDGFSDLIIGAPYAGPNVEFSGASYVVFGKASFSGDLDTNAALALSSLDGSNGFRIIGEAAHNYAGYSVSGVGDVNGDGFADLIIGADRASPNGVDRSGAAYVVVFGEASGFGPDLNLSSLDGSNGFRLSGVAAGERAGQSVSAAGDVNGDGFGDVIIGAAHDNGDNTHSGEAYVVFGKAGGFDSNINLSTLNGSNGFHLFGTGTSAMPAYAVSVSQAGDVNGDGFGDLIIGALYASPANDTVTGAAYVVFGKATGFASDVDVSDIGGSDGFRIIGAAEGDMAGYSVSAAGDVNGDGYGDVIVGAPGARENVDTPGTSYVVFGSALGFLDINLATLGIDNTYGFRLSGVALGDDSGYSVSAAGDVNGDGFDDLIVASANASPGGMDRAGESYVIFGAKFIVGTDTFVGSPGGGTLQGTTANETFIGGQGDDLIISGGGIDAFRGGAGNDTLHLGSPGSFASAYLNIDGGSGFDVLALDGSAMRLDLTADGADRVHNIERIDLTGSGDNTLVLDIRDLLNMDGNSNQLLVNGDSGDAVELKVDAGTSWTSGADQIIGGVTYHTYVQGIANLLVDQDVPVQFV